MNVAIEDLPIRTDGPSVDTESRGVEDSTTIHRDSRSKHDEPQSLADHADCEPSPAMELQAELGTSQDSVSQSSRHEYDTALEPVDLDPPPPPAPRPRNLELKSMPPPPRAASMLKWSLSGFAEDHNIVDESGAINDIFQDPLDPTLTHANWISALTDKDDSINHLRNLQSQVSNLTRRNEHELAESKKALAIARGSLQEITSELDGADMAHRSRRASSALPMTILNSAHTPEQRQVVTHNMRHRRASLPAYDRRIKHLGAGHWCEDRSGDSGGQVQSLKFIVAGTVQRLCEVDPQLPGHIGKTFPQTSLNRAGKASLQRLFGLASATVESDLAMVEAYKTPPEMARDGQSKYSSSTVSQRPECRLGANSIWD